MTTVNHIKASFPKVNVSVIDLDLSSVESVKAAAADFTAKAERLDILLLNAGVAAVAHATTAEGFEVQFGTNHVGHALLTQLLMPMLLQTASRPKSDVRVVVVSSAGHRRFLGPLDFSVLKTDMRDTNNFSLYAQSKLANLLFAKSLAQRYPRITVVSVHPGTVNTGIWGKAGGYPILVKLLKPVISIAAMTVEEGAKSQLWCCTSTEVKSGTYYDPVAKIGNQSRLAKDDSLADKLWNWTEEELNACAGSGWIKLE